MNVLECIQTGKKFSKSLKKSMMYGAIDIGLSMLGQLPEPSRLRPDEFWAVDDVNFELKPSESIGIIGANGCGKTTLLKMLNGIYMPDKGKIIVDGKVGGLIQVGAGFHPMLSGRENIYVNGAILGLTKKEIDRNFDSIVDFADIGDFLDSPVKFYSSGMYVRLGFAIAAHCRPDILLIDEVLAVGDLKFQSKCLKFITGTILKNGASVVFVSHNRYAIEDVCTRALYLKRGKVVAIGKTAEVVGVYLNDIKNEETAQSRNSNGSFSNEGITKVLIFDDKGEVCNQFQPGKSMRIRFYYSFRDPVRHPSVGITFNHNDPRFTLVSNTDYIFNIHSGYDGFEIDQLQGQGFFEVLVDPVYLPVGQYHFSVYLFADNKMNLINKYEDVGKIEAVWAEGLPKRSLIDLPRRWSRSEGAS